ncbi:hypothetical protein CP8484711_0508, partial [Chlamydia psittaci 84-8471/1]
MRTSG